MSAISVSKSGKELENLLLLHTVALRDNIDARFEEALPVVSCFYVFNLLNLPFEDSPDFKKYGQLEMKKIAAHFYKDGQLVSWSVGQLVSWSVGQLVSWSVGQLFFYVQSVTPSICGKSRIKETVNWKWRKYKCNVSNNEHYENKLGQSGRISNTT